MTKLQEEMFRALIDLPFTESGDKGVMSKAAAEVAKKYIEQAWFAGYYSTAVDEDDPSTLAAEYLKRNGITE